MTGFIVERLFPTGWRRSGEVYWRFNDALAACDRAISEDCARAVRVLPLVVNLQPVWERYEEDSRDHA
jgi:hypothetical protein